jgi:thioredoxin 1
MKRGLALVLATGLFIGGGAILTNSFERVSKLEGIAYEHAVSDSGKNSEVNPEIRRMISGLKYKPEKERLLPDTYNSMFHESGRALDNNHKAVVLEFSAEWCVPCIKNMPLLNRLAEERQDIKFIPVDTDSNQNLVEKYHVWNSGIPSYLVLDSKTGKLMHEPFFEKGKKEIRYTIYYKDMIKIIDGLEH